MCGICGFTHDGHQHDDVKNRLTAINTLIEHRGPDDDGYYLDNDIALAMRRLSIIDLAGGKQPLYSDDGNLIIVYNGETYNFEPLRSELMSRGHQFSTSSDTEVVLHLFEEYGPDCLHKMNGMFAFAVYNRQTRSLFLARDRLGIKPLFYCHRHREFSFGSELKCVLAAIKETPRQNHQVLINYLRFLYVPGEDTIFEGINRLRPGHWLTYHLPSHALEIKQYWQPEFVQESRSKDEWCEEFLALLRDSVRLRMISDVPVGTFLSGGLDSATITALAANGTNAQLNTFSIGFEDQINDELADAQLVADQYRTIHNERIVKPSAIELLPKIIKYFDEPFADSSAIPTFLLCQTAREKVKVALSGDGGDELLGGYSWIRNQYIQNRYFGWLPDIGGIGDWDRDRSPLAKAGRLINDVLSSPHEAFIRKQSCFTQAMLEKLVDPELTEFCRPLGRNDSALSPLYDDRQPFNDAMLKQNIQMYLPDDILTKVDRMSMAVSLEVRVPMLDHRIVQLVGKMPFDMKIRPNGITKYVLREAMRPYLPDRIMSKKKQGFIFPIHEWLRGDMYTFARDWLTSKSTGFDGLFCRRQISKLLDDHRSQRSNYGHQLWALLVYAIWQKNIGQNR